MAFEFPQKILFKHCDPAGIVFYPRYFEIMNDCLEAFFDQVLATPFENLLKSAGVPTVQIQTRFAAPSRHGDHLLLRLNITRIGNSSVEYVLTAHCDAQLRFETTATLVHITPDGRSAAWPDDLRSRLTAFKEAAE